MNLNKHIWEGWRVIDFIQSLEDEIRMIQNHQSWHAPFQSKAELKKYCMENQPYYKKYIPEVVAYFATEYNIK